MTQFENAVELAAKGYKVAWFGRRDRMPEHLDMASDHSAYVRRMHGFERADWSNGGRLLFLSTDTKGGRGYSVDFIFLPEELRTEEAWADIVPMVNCSRETDSPIRVVSEP